MAQKLLVDPAIDVWGQSLNDHIDVAHNLDGTLKDSAINAAATTINAAVARVDPGVSLGPGGIVQGGASGAPVILPALAVNEEYVREYGLTIITKRRKASANLRDYSSLIGVDGSWIPAMTQAQLDAWDIFVPESSDLPGGKYLIKSWMPMESGRRWHGDGAASVIANDKTNPTIDKRACFLPGLHHPALMATQTSYVLNAIGANDYAVIATTSADAANFTVGELVIIGSATASVGVSQHAQLNKIEAISAGTITLRDSIAVAISDARIWKITGTDTSTGNPVYAVEDLTIESLGFEGRAALATKGCAYGAVYRNLHMVDTHHVIATNMQTHVLIDHIRGRYSGRLLEPAFSSYDVTARDMHVQWRPPTGLQAGEAMVPPIHLGEQPYNVVLDQVMVSVDSRWTYNGDVVSIKGSNIVARDCDWHHGGSSGSHALLISEQSTAYPGFPHRNILIDNASISVVDGKVRSAQVGGNTGVDAPVGVNFRGGVLRGAVGFESLWFASGRAFACSMTDRTGKSIKVSTTAQYPNLTGYRRLPA